MSVPISGCRVCGSSTEQVLCLGELGLTGHFPAAGSEIDEHPVTLVRCEDATCRLIQLAHNYDLNTLYGKSYGYRSGLNSQMVEHLRGIATYCATKVQLNSNDTILDIGSNDGTTLGFFPQSCRRVGVDPTIAKFSKYYDEGIEKVPHFFPPPTEYSVENAKVILSIACFYDLPDPVAFAKAVSSALAPDGIWVVELSYVVDMLKAKSYDTICHEHLEYYGLHQIRRILKSGGLRIVDLSFNQANGGSMRVTASHGTEDDPKFDHLFEAESRELDVLLAEFKVVIEEHKAALLELLNKLKSQGKSVYGYGASTKGNVLLQYCRIGSDLVPKIAEINSDKFGCETPSTKIPIVEESLARKEKPDYFLVLPWHFREGIIAKEKDFLHAGGRLIFPLPRVEVVSVNGVES